VQDLSKLDAVRCIHIL